MDPFYAGAVAAAKVLVAVDGSTTVDNQLQVAL
jgi:hypothetical protein